MAMPLLEIAWFETVVAAQRDKNLPPEADERRIAPRGQAANAPPVGPARQSEGAPAKRPPR
jgi:hypothetical protein